MNIVSPQRIKRRGESDRDKEKMLKEEHTQGTMVYKDKNGVSHDNMRVLFNYCTEGCICPLFKFQKSWHFLYFKLHNILLTFCSTATNAKSCGRTTPRWGWGTSVAIPVKHVQPLSQNLTPKLAVSSFCEPRPPVTWLITTPLVRLSVGSLLLGAQLCSHLVSLISLCQKDSSTACCGRRVSLCEQILWSDLWTCLKWYEGLLHAVWVQCLSPVLVFFFRQYKTDLLLHLYSLLESTFLCLTLFHLISCFLTLNSLLTGSSNPPHTENYSTYWATWSWPGWYMKLTEYGWRWTSGSIYVFASKPPPLTRLCLLQIVEVGVQR